ncbi:MAG: hypothetical protein ABI743_00795 [bacterium]
MNSWTRPVARNFVWAQSPDQLATIDCTLGVFYAEFEPPLGIHKGVERYVGYDARAWSPLTEYSWDSTAIRQFLFDAFPKSRMEGAPSITMADGHVLRAQGAPWVPATIRWGFMVAMLDQATWNFAMESESGLPATAFTELATRFGGINPEGWKNPYTGAPIQLVPEGEGAPGDLTVLEDPDGVSFIAYYADFDGLTSARPFGRRGRYDPKATTAGLTGAGTS